LLSQPGESAVVGRGRPAIEQSGAGKHGSPRADRRHEVHFPVHPLHQVEQRSDPLGLGLRVEERPGSAAARDHQNLWRIVRRLVHVQVGQDRRTVGAFYPVPATPDQCHSKGIGRRIAIALPRNRAIVNASAKPKTSMGSNSS
jgi:hypothetical protein